ncbi:sugar phosphate isomerase/epimerase family protein [Virgibacillus litoralis]|uniref:Sugar phosphate isomerase/epimerase n=1 Tax=Virgibacillus litoralis TaxID=578221 RepID=A0ABS4HAE5_9BACI|nr:sugar phosphate isomerase/epimerase [Virgibacillus litoralis]MBP1947876.1 sugar phosphate isomerase/epimerase [Virgibacillus litoralis]
MKHKFATQLYTLRNEISKDFPSVLRELKKMGWEAVQIDGLFGYPKEEIAEVLQETGLKTAGMHVSLERMNKELEAVLKEADLFGTTDFFCASLEEDMRNLAGYKKVRRDLLDITKEVKPLGYRVGYHNHDFEFKTLVDGKFALDYILGPEESHFIHPEIDTYWVKKAGIDPISYIEKFPNQIPILHLKDMTNDDREYYAEIGTGSIDFKPILTWGEKNNVEYYAVEQDFCPGSPLDSLELSLSNLIKISEDITSK